MHEGIEKCQFTPPENKDEIFTRPLSDLSPDALQTQANNELLINDVTETNRTKILGYLEKLKEHDPDTYSHSLRVGILAAKASKMAEIQSKPALMAGLLHDIGKIQIDNDTLQKKEDFTGEDYENVKRHVLEGFNLLKDEFSFTAAVLAQHHTFQEKSYPEMLPEFHDFLDEHETEITMMARFISMLDFYDAISTRNNQKYENEILDKARVVSILIEHFPDDKDLITLLYRKKVLT
jgi:putative nucleotidyltransferase with HDIG domain